jgi:uncharacterized OsmC-like protein
LAIYVPRLLTYNRALKLLLTRLPITRVKAKLSPTDLLAESLAGCILTTMAIAGRAHDIIIDGTTAEVTKVMAADPRRVAEVVINLKFPQEYDDRQKKILQVAAHGCPVARSLHPDLKQTIDFGW